MKKNILDLSMLLTKKDEKNKKTKEAIINSFNDMMSELIKETFIKEKKNEFNYNNFNNNLTISNKERENNDDLKGLRESTKVKEKLETKKKLTQNISNNEINKTQTLKIKLNDNNFKKPKVKSRFSNLFSENNKKKNDERENGNEKDTVLEKRKSSNNKKSFIYGDRKSEDNLDKNNIKDKEEISFEKIEENLLKRRLNEELDTSNKQNIEKNNSEIEKQIEIKKESSKEINNSILIKSQNENIQEKNEEEKGNNQIKEEEKKKIIINEEKIIKIDDNESSIEKDKNKNINSIDYKTKSLSNPKDKNKLEINENPKINQKILKNFSNSQPISKSIDNNRIKSHEKLNSLSIQNNKVRLITENNTKKFSIHKNNNEKKLLFSDIAKIKKSNILKKNNLPVTKNIFSLYDYLQTNKPQRQFRNNKTEDIDTSSVKIKEKINLGDIRNNSKNFLNKDVLGKINIIKDRQIIDRPLLINQENFEVRKCEGDIEKKVLHLEYFMKKKFDELVKEIKIFIPIHFNSHTRDYNIIEK